MAPLEPEVTSSALEKILRVTQAQAIIRAGALEQLDYRPIAWNNPVPDFLKVTSGTTALPRVVRFRENQLLADCRNICRTMGLRPDDINFGVIPFAHSYGFNNLITPLLYQGTSLVCSSDRLPRALHKNLQTSQATILPATPAIFHALSALDDPGWLGSVRLCISAGAPLPAETIRQFHARYQLRIHSFYGSSECGGIAFDREGRLDAPSGFVGTPMDGVEIRCRENDRIEVHGQNVGDGYFPDAEPEVLDGTRFIPGDLVRWLEHGAQLYGRASDSINVAGKKVHPSAIEEHLRGLPGIVDVIAFGVPSPTRNEDLVALVLTQQAITRQELEAHCRSGLADWQVPRDFKIVSSLPVNARGKLKRSELAAEYLAERDLEARSKKPEAGSRKPEARSREPEARSQKIRSKK
ncbi:MAG TPA: class I adenylate-forming enzyme family protein [Chthoniobacterales bacterium]|nr:class I adenylate-forming enzyme family protein [Chthoniobacterales bacterium]